MSGQTAPSLGKARYSASAIAAAVFSFFVCLPQGLAEVEKIASIGSANPLPESPTTLPTEPNAPSPPAIEAADPDSLSLLERAFGFLEPDLTWLSDSQQGIAYGVEATARSIDHFFAGEESLELDNHSFLRLRIQPSFRKNQEDHVDVGVKFRVDLPLTEKRLRLVISSDLDQQELGAEVSETDLPEFKPSEDGSISAALKAENRETATWRASARAGVKLKFPLDPFFRSTLWRRWQLSERSAIPVRFRVTQFLHQGTVANSSISYERVINENLFFRQVNSSEWRKEIDKMQVTHVFQFVRRLAKHSVIEHNFGILEQSLHHTLLTDAYSEFDYRTRLHEDWLYLDIIPGVAFHRSDDFEPEPYFLIRIEMFFEKDSSNRDHWYYKN